MHERMRSDPAGFSDATDFIDVLQMSMAFEI